MKNIFLGLLSQLLSQKMLGAYPTIRSTRATGRIRGEGCAPAECKEMPAQPWHSQGHSASCAVCKELLGEANRVK